MVCKHFEAWWRIKNNANVADVDRQRWPFPVSRTIYLFSTHFMEKYKKSIVFIYYTALGFVNWWSAAHAANCDHSFIQMNLARARGMF